jgi:hypothetical protein
MNGFSKEDMTDEELKEELNKFNRHFSLDFIPKEDV